MAKSLVIVESPAKAKTIEKYLGEGYVVASSVGHIRDLAKAPKKKGAKKDKSSDLGFDIGVWDAHYVVSPDKKKVVAQLRKLAGESTQIYLATDLDREGEAIAWHLRECLGGEDDRFLRVVFGEITRSAITKAFAEPRTLDMDRVNSQQARRLLDRLVGFRLSPLLWRKIARGLSAGRVQSVAVRLVVEREREVRAFVPEEFWVIEVELQPKSSDKNLLFKLTKRGGKTLKINNKEEADAVLAQLKNGEYHISDCQQRSTKTRPNPPFITSTLQQAASTRLGFNVRRTMGVAQSLYEAGHITYMRTDSTNISSEAMEHCRQTIVSRFGDKYLHPEQRRYSSAAAAQEAHEAIRPTALQPDGSAPKGLKDDQVRLYNIIANRFLASQMADAEFLNTVLQAQSGEYILECKGRVVVFDGYTRVMPSADNKDTPELPLLKVGETLGYKDVFPEQKFTGPPKFYGEAALVKELEKRGIGRPSTYASIISTIQERGYVQSKNKVFRAEKLGDMVTDKLLAEFPDLMKYEFTADLELQLDSIANGEVKWKDVLDEFYSGFAPKLEESMLGESGRPSPTVDYPCENCGDDLQIKFTGTGAFLGCSNYKNDEACKGAVSLELVEPETSLEDQLRLAERCEICNKITETWHIDETTGLLLCSDSPACGYNKMIKGKFPNLKRTCECNKCGSTMESRKGRFGPYFKCIGEDCENTRKQLPSGEPAPVRMDPISMTDLRCKKYDDDYYLLREGAAGLFLAASKFPRNRETRQPLLSEVLPVLGQMPDTWTHLQNGPLKDDKGNPSVIRYSRKNATSYLGSINEEGKVTKWACWYKDGKWNVGS